MRRPPFVPVTVADRLSWEELSSVAVNAPALPGVNPEVGLSRVYPLGADFAHVVGYVGPVSDYYIEQTGDTDPVLQIPDFQVGRYNVEARMEAELRGARAPSGRGERRRPRDARARPQRGDRRFGRSADHRRGLQNYVEARLTGRKRRVPSSWIAPMASPGARLRADLRPEPLRARHQPDAVDRPQRGPVSPAGQQGDPGPLPAGLDLQDDRGAGRAGSRGRRRRGGDQLHRPHRTGQQTVPLLAAPGAWPRGPHRGHIPKLRRLSSTTSPSASGSRRSRPWRCGWAAVCAMTCRCRASRRASRPRCSGNGATAARTGSSATRSTRLSGRASC
jgi:hypothetical protein